MMSWSFPRTGVGVHRSLWECTEMPKEKLDYFKSSGQNGEPLIKSGAIFHYLQDSSFQYYRSMAMYLRAHSRELWAE